MIDINLHHAQLVVDPIDQEMAEHYQYADELNALDFGIEEQARYAIRKWLLPLKFSETGIYQCKEACRYCLTKGRDFGNVWLPGIANRVLSPSDVRSMKIYSQESNRFHLLLWNELFPEDPFVVADLANYRQRVDHGFMACPGAPNEWGEPEYKQWT